MAVATVPAWVDLSATDRVVIYGGREFGRSFSPELSDRTLIHAGDVPSPHRRVAHPDELSLDRRMVSPAADPRPHTAGAGVSVRRLLHGRTRLDVHPLRSRQRTLTSGTTTAARAV